MFLNNRKFLSFKYEISSEFDDYIEDIFDFIITICENLCDEKLNNYLSDNKISQDRLFKKFTDDITDIIFFNTSEELKKIKEVILHTDRRIVYLSLQKKEKNLIVGKLNNTLNKNFAKNNFVSDFWKSIIEDSEPAGKIIAKFLKAKNLPKQIIAETSEPKSIDFLPVYSEDIELGKTEFETYLYSENEKHFNFEEIRKIFNLRFEVNEDIKVMEQEILKACLHLWSEIFIFSLIFLRLSIILKKKAGLDINGDI